MPNFKNRALFHGENLDILRGMDGATVDLIATDPPFNKGRDFHATPESGRHGSGSVRGLRDYADSRRTAGAAMGRDRHMGRRV